MKNMLALTLALCIALSMAATPALAEQTDLNKDAPLVMWLPGNGAVPGLEEGATENDNQFINAIREATGYKNLQVSVMPATDPQTNMNLLLASGEYPDAVYVNGLRDFYLRYLTEGLWAPVDESVANYGPAIEGIVTDEAWAAVQGDDGLHYGIPNPLHTSYNGHLLGGGILYRKDILDALGLAAPTTPAEFKAVLEAVKAAYPDMVPYSYAASGTGSNTLDDANVFTAAFGMWQPYALIDGNMENTKRLYMKDYLAYMNSLYADGLLDPEFLYQTDTNKTEKVIAGNVFAFNDGVWCKTIRQSWAATGYEGRLAFVPQMKNADGTSGGAQPFPIANCYMIPATSEHMDEVVNLVNTFLTDRELESFINFGTENVHYTVNEDGSYSPLEPEYSKVIYKIYYRLWFKPDVWWNNAVLGDFVPEIQLWDAANPDGLTNVNVFAYEPTTQASLDYKSACNDIYKEYVSKIIVGDLPVEAVTELFEKIDAAGYTEIEAADLAWYESTGAALAESLKK